MSSALSPTLAGAAPARSNRDVVKRVGLFVALAALLAIVWMPPAQGLPPAGQVMLGILAFAVVLRMTKAVDGHVVDHYRRHGRAWV